MSNASEPGWAGRVAFWNGRAIWMNPYIGTAARAFTASWRREEQTFLAASGLPPSERYDAALLAKHRPADLPDVKPPRVVNGQRGNGARLIAKGHNPRVLPLKRKSAGPGGVTPRPSALTETVMFDAQDSTESRSTR